MKIQNMTRVDIPAAPFVEANFDVELDGGITIRDCLITDGRSGFAARLPGRGRRDLVELPPHMRAEFNELALMMFRHLPDDANDSGLRRVLGEGERESLRKAGI